MDDWIKEGEEVPEPPLEEQPDDFLSLERHIPKLGSSADHAVVLNRSITRLNQLPELGSRRRGRIAAILASVQGELAEYQSYRANIQK